MDTLSHVAVRVQQTLPARVGKVRMVDAREVDVVLVWKRDRALREPLDLEYLIPRFDKAGVRFAEAEGSIDLGTDSGRLHARIMIAVAKAEQDRKAERRARCCSAAGASAGSRGNGPKPGCNHRKPLAPGSASLPGLRQPVSADVAAEQARPDCGPYEAVREKRR